MNYENFVANNKLISIQLDQIATRTANMAWLGKANTDNPEFVELMKAQERLIAAADRLLKMVEASSG